MEISFTMHTQLSLGYQDSLRIGIFFDKYILYVVDQIKVWLKIYFEPFRNSWSIIMNLSIE